MWGRATLAMLVSRTSMNAARETTHAMSQGLAFGVHAEAGFGRSTVVLTVVRGNRGRYDWELRNEHFRYYFN